MKEERIPFLKIADCEIHVVLPPSKAELDLAKDLNAPLTQADVQKFAYAATEGYVEDEDVPPPPKDRYGNQKVKKSV
jgi:hypothetical protein